MTMTQSSYFVTCPACETSFPVDPSRVPAGGVRAICSTCMRVFQVDPPEAVDHIPADIPADPVAARTPELEVQTESPVESASAPIIDAEVEDEFGDAEVRIEVDDEAADSLDDFGDSEFEVEEEPQDPVDEVEAEVDLDEPIGETGDEAVEVDEAATVDEEDIDVATVEEEAAEPSPVADQSLSKAAARFGRRDPHDRAKRLARVLVSDMLTYHPAQYEEAVSQGRLKEEFEEEIRLSWEEYEEQIGRELAESTDYFIEALNEILARGETLFRGVGRPE